MIPHGQPTPQVVLAPDQTLRLMRYDARKKSVGVTYLLWFFLGWLGVYRFYLGHWPTGLLLLAMAVLAIPTFGLSLILTGLILFLDMFFIPGMVHRHNERLIRKLSK